MSFTGSFTLYVGNLSYFCTEQDLFNCFSQFGRLVSIKIMYSKIDGSCLGYGFISFDNIYSYEKALRINGSMFMGRKLKVNFSHRKDNLLHEKEKETICVHFSFISKQKNYLVNELFVRNLFDKESKIEDVIIRRSSLDLMGFQSGYGFIHYPLNDDGLRLLSEILKIRQEFIGCILFDFQISNVSQYLLYI